MSSGASHGQGSQQFNYHSARGHPARARGRPVRAAGRPGYGDQRRPGCGDPRHGRCLGSRWWSARLRCSSATYVASVGRVSRGCFTSFYGPPTLEFLRFLALLPSILPTMPAAALMSALGKFRFIGSRPRLCSWARYCGGLRISLSDGGNPAFRLHPQGRALVPRSAEIPVTGASRDRLSALVSSGRLRIAGSAPESLSPHPARSASPAATSVERMMMLRKPPLRKLLLRKPAPRFP